LTDDFISIGRITSTFGLKGFLKVASSGDILSSLEVNSPIYLSPDSVAKTYKLLEIRRDKNQFIISLEGFRSIEESTSLIGKILYFPKQESEGLLGENEYFIHQLVGLYPYSGDSVYTDFTLREIIENPAHPILLFSDNVTEILVPYINQFVGKVDLKNAKIEILNWEDWINAD
jgi:16S rRNA processing protein RimM